MYKYKLLISYDGTNYSGWQIQPNALSIQECLEKALHTLLKAEIRIVGAGRTDAGAHALGQTAHFLSPHILDCERTLYALNSLLPHDIRVKEVEEVPDHFHAQYSACGKIYAYHIWTQKTIDPFFRLYRHHYFYPFSPSLLSEAKEHFIGTKDFKTFANVGVSLKTSVRTIWRIDCVEEEGGYRLEFEGNGFLYKMVRNIVGTLLEVASEKRALSEIPQLLEACDRRKAGMAVPAKGLFLVKVHYPDIFSQNLPKEEK